MKISCWLLGAGRHNTTFHQVRNFCCQPWCQAQTQSLRYSKMRTVLSPQRLEMDCEAYFSSSIHFCSLTFQLWYLYLGSSHWIGCWNIELEVELVFDKFVDVPTCSFPVSSVLVIRFNGKPVRVRRFPNFNIFDQCVQLLETRVHFYAHNQIRHKISTLKVTYLFQSLLPSIHVSRSRRCREQWDLLNCRPCVWIPRFRHNNVFYKNVSILYLNKLICGIRYVFPRL